MDFFTWFFVVCRVTYPRYHLTSTTSYARHLDFCLVTLSVLAFFLSDFFYEFSRSPWKFCYYFLVSLSVHLVALGRLFVIRVCLYGRVKCFHLGKSPPSYCKNGLRRPCWPVDICSRTWNRVWSRKFVFNWVLPDTCKISKFIFWHFVNLFYIFFYKS